MDISHFVYPSVSRGHLDCFYLLAIVNNATIGFVYKFFAGRMCIEYLFSFLLILPTNVITGLNGLCLNHFFKKLSKNCFPK